MRIDGLQELREKLDAMADRATVRAIAEKALRAGGEVARAAIEERTPVRTTPVTARSNALPVGKLRASVRVWMDPRYPDGNGVLIGFRAAVAHVARFVEYGHRLVVGGYSKLDKRTGLYRGPGHRIADVPAYPFIRPAYEASRQEMVEVTVAKLRAEIEKEAAAGPTIPASMRRAG